MQLQIAMRRNGGKFVKRRKQERKKNPSKDHLLWVEEENCIDKLHARTDAVARAFAVLASDLRTLRFRLSFVFAIHLDAVSAFSINSFRVIWAKNVANRFHCENVSNWTQKKNIY